MVTEKEIIDDLFVLSGKLKYLAINRVNNSKFWDDINEEVTKIIKTITSDKRIYGW